jgi:integrase
MPARRIRPTPASNLNPARPDRGKHDPAVITMRHCLQDLRPGVTVHGLQATFRSWAGGCTTHPRDVCETALGHSIGSSAEQAYQRDALVAKRRVLMADWAEFCASDRATNVLRMDVGRQRPPPQSDDGPTSVGRDHCAITMN